MQMFRRGTGVLISLLLVAVVACGGKQADPGTGSAGAADSAGAAGNPGAAGNAGGNTAGAGGGSAGERFASNGVRIPSFDETLREPCGYMEIETGPCPGNCQRIDCDCGSSRTYTPEVCMSGRCITAMSCERTCKLEVVERAAVLFCAELGVCAEDSDCSNGGVCVRSKGLATGQCSHGSRGALCYGDDDCVGNPCVVTDFGSGVCGFTTVGEPCNLDSQCAAPAHCVLAEGAFAGVCRE